MKLVVLASIVSLFALSGCRSDDTVEADFDCTCGTREAAMNGCLHSLCRNGETNPDNPDCACGTLTFDQN